MGLLGRCHINADHHCIETITCNTILWWQKALEQPRGRNGSAAEWLWVLPSLQNPESQEYYVMEHLERCFGDKLLLLWTKSQLAVEAPLNNTFTVVPGCPLTKVLRLSSKAWPGWGAPDWNHTISRGRITSLSPFMRYRFAICWKHSGFLGSAIIAFSIAYLHISSAFPSSLKTRMYSYFNYWQSKARSFCGLKMHFVSRITIWEWLPRFQVRFSAFALAWEVT